MSSPAIRWIARGTKVPAASIQLFCRVKSGVSADTEGVRTISDNAVEVSVAARARNGEANKALIQVIAEALKVPKTDVDVVKGTKSKEKTILVRNIIMNGTVEEHIEKPEPRCRAAPTTSTLDYPLRTNEANVREAG